MNNCNKFLNPFTKEESCLKSIFLQCRCIKINSNFKILLYYWSPFKFGSIFTCWHVKKDDYSNWIFFSQTKITLNILTWGTQHEYFGLGRMCVFDMNSFKYNLITKHDFPFHFQVRQIIHVIGNWNYFCHFNIRHPVFYTVEEGSWINSYLGALNCGLMVANGARVGP